MIALIHSTFNTPPSIQLSSFLYSVTVNYTSDIAATFLVRVYKET